MSDTNTSAAAELGFTPGPWGYRRAHPDSGLVDDPFRQAMQEAWYLHGAEDDSDFLADIFLKNHDGNGEADIRLIAAAPEMMEAIKDFVDYARNRVNDKEAWNKVCRAFGDIICKVAGVPSETTA
jgi:hypothetical protein